MSRPGVGNPGNSGGKKGIAGRKSAYKERQDAESLWELWETVVEDAPEYIDNLKHKGRSPKQVFLAKLLAGNDRALAEVFRKLYPDKVEDVNETLRLQEARKVTTLLARYYELTQSEQDAPRAPLDHLESPPAALPEPLGSGTSDTPPEPASN